MRPVKITANWGPNEKNSWNIYCAKGKEGRVGECVCIFVIFSPAAFRPFFPVGNLFPPFPAIVEGGEKVDGGVIGSSLRISSLSLSPSLPLSLFSQSD